MVREWMQWQADDGMRDDTFESLQSKPMHTDNSPFAMATGAPPSPHIPEVPSESSPRPHGLTTSKPSRMTRSAKGMFRPLPLAHVANLQPGAFSETVADVGSKATWMPTPRPNVSAAGSVAPLRRVSAASGSYITGDLSTCAPQPCRPARFRVCGVHISICSRRAAPSAQGVECQPAHVQSQRAAAGCQVSVGVGRQ
jgi:hypothetical protein